MYRFCGDFRAGHTAKNAKFPVVGPRTTTSAADCVFDEGGNMIETHEQEGELKRTRIQLFVVPCGRIRCFKRNLREQRLRRAQRCGEAATGSRANFINTGWVSPRVIPGSPQSLSELLSNMPL